MDPLLQPLYWFSDHDPLLAAHAVEHILVTGASGSGKSSTAMMQIIMGFLTNGYGGLFLSAKAEDTRNYIQYIKSADREKDLIVFGPDSGEAIDPLFYIWNRPGRGSAMLETVVDIFTLLMAVGSPHHGKSNEPFFERKTEQLMRAAIVLLHLAGERISIYSIDRIIATFPTTPGQHETPEWQEEYAGEVLAKIRSRYDSLSAQQHNDLTRALHFVCVEWASLDPRPQSSVLATWTSLSDKFLYEPFRSCFSDGKCTWIPEDIAQANKLVICDFPLLEGGDTFRIATCLVKVLATIAFAQRDVTKHPTPIFLASDEAQLTVLPKGREERFTQVCRSARCAFLAATQNLQQLASEFGEESLGPKVSGWIANFGTRIAMSQTDSRSNEMLSDTIGKVYQPIGGTSFGNQSANVNTQLHLEHRLLPAEFITLQKASIEDPCAEAIVFSGGRIFSNGQPYLHTRFSRDYP